MRASHRNDARLRGHDCIRAVGARTQQLEGSAVLQFREHFLQVPEAAYATHAVDVKIPARA